MNTLFQFNSDISSLISSKELNNPFANNISEIAKNAAQEFQEFLKQESQSWDYDFNTQKGKMFGVLVVEDKQGEYAFLGAVSGKLPNNIKCDKLVPSVFDDSVEDNFIGKGMTALSKLSAKIKETSSQELKEQLKLERATMSHGLQQKLFENYSFLNLNGETKNVIEIFHDSGNGYPPTAAGECTAPKLLNFALENELKPIAIAEFWWGKSSDVKEKNHKEFYPACEQRCKPILEYMLDNSNLFAEAQN